MLNIKTVYRKKLFENLRNGRYSSKTQKLSEALQLPNEKKEEITSYLEFKNIIACFGKEKQCLSANKKRLDISLEKIIEALRNSNNNFTKLAKIKFKLDKIIDIFYSSHIPPTIKCKRNVIVVIENENSKRIKNGSMTCPDCLKEEILKGIKRKILNNFKEKIVLIRKKLLKGLSKKKEFIFQERPKPAFLIMDDLVAPFPEMESNPIPVFSFAKDGQQERRKCKTEQRPATNKDNLSQEIFHQWVKETLLKTEKTEISPVQEIRARPEEQMGPAPLSQEDFLQNVGSFLEEGDNRESGTKINYNKNTIEVVQRNGQSRDNKGNRVTSENNLNKIIQNNNHMNFLSTPKVTKIMEDVTLTNLDVSNPNVVIIPVLKPKEKGGKRDIIIKLQNVPDCVDVIKIKSLMSNIYKACEVKKYSNYFLKNYPKPSLNNIKIETTNSNRRKIRTINYTMTCPNKNYNSSSKVLFPSPYFPGSNVFDERDPNYRTANRMKKDFYLRSYKKNDCFYDE